MNNQNKNNLKLYYDGQCMICSREIKHYKKQKGAENIEFIDICALNFNPESQGLDSKKIHKVIHAKKSDGTILTRVDVFIEVWKLLPKFNFLAKIASIPFIKFFLEIGYTLFTILRKILPKIKN